MGIASNSNKIILLPSDHPTQYELVTMVVATPSTNPDITAMTQARPFEFTLDMPSKFSAMCPFCCAGFYISACDMIEKYGHKFVSCPECGAGKLEIPIATPKLIDPFVNPFNSKQLTRCELDEAVTPINNISSIDDTRTVAQKMSERNN